MCVLVLFVLTNNASRFLAMARGSACKARSTRCLSCFCKSREKSLRADTHVNYDANVNTTVNKLRQALGESTDKPLYIETIPRKGYSFISTAEFSDVPFVVAAPAGAQTGGSGRSAEASEIASTDSPRTKRWLTLIIVGLILAGMLLGAGVATYWISHFAPQLRHSAAKNANCVPSSNAC